jgi:methyl coenzyme M reductase gamma subunit
MVHSTTGWEKKLASIMKTMKQKEGLDTKKRLTKHSARNYLIQTLKDNDVEDTDIMQISGHKNGEKYKPISNVLAGAGSDNSRALVPIQTTTASTNVSRAIVAST